ncbi:hypothetical protein SLS63_008008 [Diaporthe eres]|uniref:Uncharacterized protein n=1 Tax=Diaporthe eres TaxID=83184 RepID=A0ABR1P3K7_DIAER
MGNRLAGKNAIITGAAGGVGLETSILMLQEGASVLMTDVHDVHLQEALAKVKEIVPNDKGKVATKLVDVSKEAEVEAAVNAVDEWGGVDIMFNNAGIMHPEDGDAEECSDGIWDLTMKINVKGVWFGSKHAVRSLRRHGKTKGSVINTASMVALVGSATPQVAYTASKGADFLGDDKAKRFRREIHFPTGRFGQAIEQAYAAVFLASDESSFVNATDFVVDGGLTKAYVTPEGPAIAAPANQGH